MSSCDQLNVQLHLAARTVNPYAVLHRTSFILDDKGSRSAQANSKSVFHHVIRMFWIDSHDVCFKVCT